MRRGGGHSTELHWLCRAGAGAGAAARGRHRAGPATAPQLRCAGTLTHRPAHGDKELHFAKFHSALFSRGLLLLLIVNLNTLHKNHTCRSV